VDGRLIPVGTMADTDMASWVDLGGRAVEHNPMNEPHFVVPAARWLPDGPEIDLVVTEHGGQWSGAVPVKRVNRLGGIPVKAVTTNVRRMTYLGTPLLDPHRTTDAARGLLSTLMGHRRQGDFNTLIVQWLGDDGPASAALRQATEELGLPIIVYEAFEQPFLTRHVVADYAESQSVKHRKDYERRARRMAETIGGELELVNRADDPAAVEDYIALEAAGYKTDIGVAMTTAAGEPEYFREMCARFAGLGRLHVLQLQAAGRLIAMQISVEAGDGLFLVKVGHDDAFGRFDPGVQLHFRAMEYFHHETAATFVRVCTFGGNPLLLRLYPERRPTSTWIIGLGNRMDQAVLRALLGAREVRRRVRQRGYWPRRDAAAERNDKAGASSGGGPR